MLMNFSLDELLTIYYQKIIISENQGMEPMGFEALHPACNTDR